MGKSTPPAVAPEVRSCNLANSSEASRKHEGYLSLRAGVDYHYLQIGQCSVAHPISCLGIAQRTRRRLDLFGLWQILEYPNYEKIKFDKS